MADELLGMHGQDSDLEVDARPQGFSSGKPVAEAYTDRNFKTKKALKDAVASGQQITVYQPNGDITGYGTPRDGRVSVEGPHYPEPHRWYATVTLKDGIVVAVS